MKQFWQQKPTNNQRISLSSALSGYSAVDHTWLKVCQWISSVSIQRNNVDSGGRPAGRSSPQLRQADAGKAGVAACVPVFAIVYVSLSVVQLLQPAANSSHLRCRYQHYSNGVSQLSANTLTAGNFLVTAATASKPISAITTINYKTVLDWGLRSHWPCLELTFEVWPWPLTLAFN